MVSLYFDWSTERVQLLKHLWNEEGKSATAIANYFGDGLTRSAVIGKIHRDGLNNREPTFRQVRKAKPAKPYARRRKPTVSSTRGALALLAVDEPEVVYSEPVPVAPENRTNIFMLTKDTCRWPIGDPRHKDHFHFCGAEPKDDSVYCGYHHRLSYQPAPVRQRQNILAEQRALSR